MDGVATDQPTPSGASPDPDRTQAMKPGGADPGDAAPPAAEFEGDRTEMIRPSDAAGAMSPDEPEATGPMASGDLDDDRSDAVPPPAVDRPDADATQMIAPADAPSAAEPPSTEPPSAEPSESPVPSDPPAASPPVADPDATRAVEPSAMPPADADRTSVLSANDAATSIVRPLPSDATAIVAPGAVPAPPPPGDGKWKGQAGVRPVTPDGDVTGSWAVPEPRRAWWLPIVLGIVGLLVLVGAAFALVVAMKGGSTPTPATSPPPTLSVTTPPVSDTPTPSTPSPSDSVTVGLVVVPTSLNGLFLSDAETLLSQMGLNFTETPQISDTALPNTVIGTSPGAGTSVPVGSTVVLIYAQAPPPISPSESPPSPPSPPSPSPSTS